MEYIHNWKLCSCKKEWNLAVCCNLNGTLGTRGQWNKSKGEEKTLDDLTCQKWREKQNERNKSKQSKIVSNMDKAWAFTEMISLSMGVEVVD